MGVPQFIVMCLYVAGLGMMAGKHGEPMGGNYNFWVGLISTSIMVSLLWWGGFFQ